MRWSERTECHDDDFFAHKFREEDGTPKPPRDGFWEYRHPEKSGPLPEPVRKCWYCGSIHPEDLVRVLGDGASMSGTDKSYKFYVHGVPNPNAGVIIERGGTYYADGTYEPAMHPASAELPVKFYTSHLRDDMDDEAFETLTDAIANATGIKFRR